MQLAGVGGQANSITVETAIEFIRDDGRSVTVRGVARKRGARVTVAGLSHANARGPTARASIKGETKKHKKHKKKGR